MYNTKTIYMYLKWTIKQMKIYYFIILVLLPISAFPNEASKVNELAERIEFLETYNKTILNKQFEVQSVELSNKVSEELKHAKDEINDQYTAIKIASWVCGILISIGVGTVIYQLGFGIKNRVEKSINQKLNDHIAENSQAIIDIITSQKTENLIRKNKSVTVLSNNEQNNEYIIALLRNMGFEQVHQIVINRFFKFTKADLYIFSDKDNSLSEMQIKECIEKSQDDTNFIYFGTRRLNIPLQDSYAERLNFANTKYTLYHQIINTLSFKEVLKNS